MGEGEEKRAAARQGQPLLAGGLPALWAGLSKSLRIALGATLAVTAGVLALPASDSASDASVAPVVAAVTSSPSPSSSAPPGATWSAWQRSLRPEFPEAEADPFSNGAAAVTAVAAPPAPAPLVGPPPPPPPPPPPQTQFRVLGWFGVSGDAPKLLLSDGQVEKLAAPGLALPDGFVVRAIEPRGVVLRHAASQTEVVLPLPESLPRRADGATAAQSSR